MPMFYRVVGVVCAHAVAYSSSVREPMRGCLRSPFPRPIWPGGRPVGCCPKFTNAGRLNIECSVGGVQKRTYGRGPRPWSCVRSCPIFKGTTKLGNSSSPRARPLSKHSRFFLYNIVAPAYVSVTTRSLRAGVPAGKRWRLPQSSLIRRTDGVQ